MGFIGLLAFSFAAIGITNVLGAPAPQSSPTTSLCADGVNLAVNLQCCKWFAVREKLVQDVFEGICGENAHSTVRIAFHDAIGFSIHGGLGGGADGSIIQFPKELNYAANAGIDDIVSELQPVADMFHVSYGDIIQFGAAVALSLCPGAPRVTTFVGRPNATAAAPDGTVPDPFDSVPTILARMADAGFSPADLVALLASHSIAAQDQIEPSIHGSPFDSTPSSFDPQFFLEVLLKGTVLPGGVGPGQGEVLSPLDGEFRLQSDFRLARAQQTACTWQSFVNDQSLMAQQFGAVMARLALLGQNVLLLNDCTEVIKKAAPATETTAVLPPGKTKGDIEASCSTAAFPSVPTAPGTSTSIAPVPTQ